MRNTILALVAAAALAACGGDGDTASANGGGDGNLRGEFVEACTEYYVWSAAQYNTAKAARDFSAMQDYEAALNADDPAGACGCLFDTSAGFVKGKIEDMGGDGMQTATAQRSISDSTRKILSGQATSYRTALREKVIVSRASDYSFSNMMVMENRDACKAPSMDD